MEEKPVKKLDAPTALEASLRHDSPQRIAAEAAAVRDYFSGENASMMGGWT